MAQKRMVDLDEVLKLLKRDGLPGSYLEAVEHAAQTISAYDASTSSPEHRTLTGLPVEFAALKERMEKVEKTNAVLVEAETGICNRLAKLEASVADLKHPAKYDPTRPSAPAPLPPPAPAGYEHLDPPEFRVVGTDDLFISEPERRIVLRGYAYLGYTLDQRRWIVRPKPVAAAAPKKEWKVNEVAEFSAFRGVVRSPIGLIEGGFAYFYDSERGWQLTKKVSLADLRRPGGAA